MSFLVSHLALLCEFLEADQLTNVDRSIWTMFKLHHAHFLIFFRLIAHFEAHGDVLHQMNDDVTEAESKQKWKHLEVRLSLFLSLSRLTSMVLHSLGEVMVVWGRGFG